MNKKEKTEELPKVLYRYEAVAEWDIENECYVPAIELKTFNIISYTPKGCWIYYKRLRKKFVLRNTTKAYAYANKEDAFRNLRRRTRTRLWHVENHLEYVKNLIELIKKMEEENGKSN